MGTDRKTKVYLDLSHLGRHVTGIERIAIEQFEKAAFEGADVIAVRANGLISMLFKQQIVLPLLALRHRNARFAFPGFPPSPLFSLCRERAVLYVHDTFLIMRPGDLSLKARLYMAPAFKIALRHLKYFLVNSEKTSADLARHTRVDASIRLYRPGVANVFGLQAEGRQSRGDASRPLKLVALGTVEPRKNYPAALAILDGIRAAHDSAAELHIIGRAGWDTDGQRITAHAGVTVHGYLPADDVRRIMDEADVYLCTSHDEGLGLPLLEAQFAGLAVAAPGQAVFREVLAASGTFFDPADPGAAAKAIADLVSQSGWRARAARAALANVARWNGLAAKDLASVRTIFSGPDLAVAPTSLPSARAS